ncbi:tripartite tricarboxylate transporter permease [Salinactinospora qingdaonensis]|uniref:Tripartite tricarboxylate transporter permease n=1 Tax=Salinactinospora qingdaonensis TaxID=702744 RepID=A0ABP7FXH0_9ACTN
MIEGLLASLQPMHLLYLLGGVLGGVLVGCLPGLTATMGTALLVPFTFVMEPTAGLVMLGGLYIGAMYGDAIPACLVNIPGTPSSLATSFDGFPMTEKGQGRRALIAACFSSAVGAVVGGVALLLLSPPLAALSLQFGPPEFFWLGILALTIMGSIVGKSFLRGIGAGMFGLLLSTIGVAVSGGETRFTFDQYQLMGGISLPVVLIGLFAIPQLIKLIEGRRTKSSIGTLDREKGVLRKTLPRAANPVNLARSSVLGTVIGILPGAGSPIAALISYNEAKRWSRNKRQFGKGAIEGVVASETANNAAAPASMVPTLTLGVPGSSPSAVILGALLLHGLRPGGELFQTNPDIVYAFIWAMIIGGLLVFVVGVLFSPLLVSVVAVPVQILVPAIAGLAVVGSFAIRNNIFDVYLMFIIGVAGYLLTKVGVPVAPVALGIILGPIVESGLDTALSMAQGSSYMEVFVLRPISAGLILLTVASIVWTVLSRRAERRRQLAGEDDPDEPEDPADTGEEPDVPEPPRGEPTGQATVEETDQSEVRSR